MLFCACAKSLQLCLTLCDSMDCRPPGYSVHGILQARILEWVAISSSRRSSRPRDGTHVSYVSCIGRQVPYHSRHLESPRTMQESGLTEIMPLTYPVLSGTRILCFSILSLLRVPCNPAGSGGLLTAKCQAFFVSILITLWAYLPGSCNVMATSSVY